MGTIFEQKNKVKTQEQNEDKTKTKRRQNEDKTNIKQNKHISYTITFGMSTDGIADFAPGRFHPNFCDQGTGEVRGIAQIHASGHAPRGSTVDLVLHVGGGGPQIHVWTSKFGDPRVRVVGLDQPMPNVMNRHVGNGFRRVFQRAFDQMRGVGQRILFQSTDHEGHVSEH